MRNTLPLLSRTPMPLNRAQSPMPTDFNTPPTHPLPIPIIRLTTATPSVSGTPPPDIGISPIAPKPSGEPRKRVVPKKSKLGLLSGSRKEKERGKDLSDVMRRLGTNASTGRSFDIYVDPTDDPDIGEIVVVKKKKSRAKLDGLWGNEVTNALGDVTNVPTLTKEREKPLPSPLLDVKIEENQKWWSIGRGKKEVKENKKKEKEKALAHSKSPELDSRTRAHSLDSGNVLNSIIAPVKFEPEAADSTEISDSRRRAHSLDSETVLKPLPATVREPPLRPAPELSGVLSGEARFRTASGMSLLVPPNPNQMQDKPASGSIALRAMKSMRSLAHIRSWAQLRNGNPDESEKDQLPKEKKKKEKKTSKMSSNSATSSFEVGAPSPLLIQRTMGASTTGPFGTTRTMSSMLSDTSSGTSSILASSNRLSVASSDKRTSTSSYASSMEGRQSKRSSGSSIRWEDQLATVKEKRSKDKDKTAKKKDKDKTKTKDSRRSGEGRKRPLVTSIFPQAVAKEKPEPPMLVVQAASPDRENEPLSTIDSSMDTPVRKVRPRPMSEQLLGQARPRGIVGETDGLISILDAATSDLASLIGRLDLEATPDASPRHLTPRSTRVGQSDAEDMTSELSALLAKAADSPLKKGALARASNTSLTSLRPYAQSRGKQTFPTPDVQYHASLIGRHTAAWPVPNVKTPLETVQEMKITSPMKPSEAPVFNLTHKRTMSPPSPAREPMQVFQPLRPAKTKSSMAPSHLQAHHYSPVFNRGSPDVPQSVHATPTINNTSVIASSSLTFGVAPPKVLFGLGHASEGSFGGDTSIMSFTNQGTIRASHRGHHRRKSSAASNHNLPIASETRKKLGMGGTMGSTGSALEVMDPDDPDSDIPEELQVILSSQSEQSDSGSVDDVDDTLSFREPLEGTHESSSTRPPNLPLPIPEIAAPTMPMPVFRARLIDDEANEADVEESSESSEDDTKKSFDFTGELRRLNESGASDRLSFVEQVENAFKTPAKIDLNGFGKHLGLDGPFLRPGNSGPVPPLPDLPPLPPMVKQQMEASMEIEDTECPEADVGFVSEVADDSGIEEVPCEIKAEQPKLRSTSSAESKSFDGELNRDFKFGGKTSTEQLVEEKAEQLLTFSDIIPPSDVSNLLSVSIGENDNSVLESIYEKAVELPQPPVSRSRLDSDSSSKRRARDEAMSKLTAHTRNSSSLSFTGFSAFEEVRRGFEFNTSRPTFYPPADTSRSNNSRNAHFRDESLFSIASVSSYGAVIHSGMLDPFDYGLPARPTSVDMSVSVDDTFEFIRPGQPIRKRLDSDASSFYFNPMGKGQRKHHSHNDSVMSTMSGPPISLYNRSFGGHRRQDSNTSGSSIAHAYGVLGANGGRAAWAKHRHDFSVDSSRSDFSAARLGRPGVGDKMFDSIHDYSAPLSAISASPPASANRSSYDSISDDDRRLSNDSILGDDERRSSMEEDSLFEKTGHRSSMSSDSVFGYDEHRAPARGANLFVPNQFRPVSMLSVPDAPNPHGEDDTMISMLGGGHVRRQSIGSVFEASPCVRLEKRIHHDRMNPAVRDDSEDDYDIEASVNRARIVQKVSMASAKSHKFGSERMALARRGILERPSLEDSCLSGEGEDMSLTVHTQPDFRRTSPIVRSRPDTYISVSSGTETPPLSASDGSSQSSGSQSSIDLVRLSEVLTNITYPMTHNALTRVRRRARGTGHRRRTSQAHASRVSAYETIQEEVPGLSNTPSPARLSFEESDEADTPVVSPIYRSSPEHEMVEVIEWDDEQSGLIRKYCALKVEAHETLQESKRMWEDTPFSVYALQAFDPPKHPAGMQALLEHSQKTYVQLPAEIRALRRRSRTLSRPSPYPRSRKSSLTASTEKSIPQISLYAPEASPLKELSVNTNHKTNTNILSPAPALQPLKPVSPLILDWQNKSNKGLEIEAAGAMGMHIHDVRRRVASNARRSALGWSKRSSGKSSVENKENAVQGMLTSPPSSLRIVRPRPKGRPTPGNRKPIRV